MRWEGRPATRGEPLAASGQSRRSATATLLARAGRGHPLSPRARPGMLITRTPLRISLGGGGTDLPSFYRQRAGFVISAAISKYMFIGLNRTFTDDYLLKYSGLERRAKIDDIEHAIVREVFRQHEMEPGIEMVSLADIPSGTGLGSSGAFTVGLLRAVYALKREHVTAGALAEEAAHIEIDVLQEPVGKQDQYIAAFGGLTCLEFHSDDRVTVTPLQVSQDTLHQLEERLLLFFTGYSRSAGSILADQHTRSQDGDEEMLANLEETKALGRRIRTALEAGEPEVFGALMHEHWERKRARSQGMTNDRIDEWYRLGRDSGAIGGKLVGAGTGGFLMFYAEDPTRLRKAFAEESLQETRFTFDLDGSTVVVRD
jgi:D-glycero-alpha-D-manno-heptose-7-phosphate kinase